MIHDDYMTPKGRTNNLLSVDTANTNPIHVFTNPSVLSPPISALKGECQRRGIPVEVYSNPEDLLGLVSRLKQKAFIVIQTPRVSATDISWVFPQKFTFPKTDPNLKVVTFPGKISSVAYDQAKQKNDVLAMYDKHFGIGKQSSKIKLRKVHSSKDIKYELASPQSNKQSTANKQVLFQKLLYNDYKVQPDSEFKILIDSIKNTPNTAPCLNIGELKTYAEEMKGKGNKLLFLVDEKGLKLWREFVEKSKLESKVEFMVLGDLTPSKELLKSNVYFASDNGQEILNELEKLKFQQVQRCRGEYIRLSTNQKNQFKFSQQSIRIQPYATPINNTTPQKPLSESQPNAPRINRPQLHRMSEQFSASIFSNASSQFQRYMRNWTVDIDPKAKDRKNAEYVTMEEEGKQHIEGPSEPMSKRASRITARRNSSESSDDQYSNTANNLVEEYNRLKHTNNLSNSTVNITVPNDFEFNKMHSSNKEITPSKHSSVTLIEQKSPQKKVIQIIKKPSDKHQTKHQQIPSNVIQETSQQYRGSNRQSIVNLDDHFYHYQGSGNNLGGSAGNVTGGNFSKVKNGMLGPVQQQGMRKTVHQDHTYPAENRIVNLGYDNPKQQQLPIDSPPHSQMKMKERVIDGLTGELIGNYNSRFELIDNVVDKERNDKKVYETITVVPYQAESAKPIQAGGSNYESRTNFNDARSLGYDANSQKAYSQSSVQNNQNTTTNPISTGQAFIIDGLSGQLLGQSYKRMQSVGTVSAYTPSAPIMSASSKSPQILRPSHYIQPQIVKIPSSSASIRQVSKESIATQKKINNQYNSNNSISNNHIESTTSITETYGGNGNNVRSNNVEVIGSPRNNVYSNNNTTTTTTYVNSYNTNKNTYSSGLGNQPAQVIRNQVRTISSGDRGNSPSINYSTTPQTITNTTNYHTSANYKVYTPQQYAAKYENGPTKTITTSVINNNANTYNTTYTTSTSNNPQSNNYTTKEYTTRQYTTTLNQNYSTTPRDHSSSNYYQTTTKQPEVINRVYIKASDLPQSTSNNYTNKRYEQSPSHYVHDYKAKLTVEDTDPFNERTPSKNSSLRKGSYLKRKQDGKRDPYSPYEENTSQLLANQKSGVKVYTSEEYQKVVDNRKFTSPSKDSSAIDLNNYDRVIQNGVAVYKPKNNYTTTTTKVQTKQMQPSRDNYHQSKVTVVNGYKSGVTRYEPSGRDYANSPTRRQGSSYQKALRTENPLRRPSTQTRTQTIKNVQPLREQRVTPLVYDSRSPMKVTQYRSQAQKSGTAYTYNSPTKHVYQRRQMMQPRVQASNFNDRVQLQATKTNERQKGKAFVAKDNHTSKVVKQTKQQQIPQSRQSLPENEIGIISGIHKNSEIFELSDGSIMRRNNIKFGINKYKGPRVVQEDFEYLGQLKSRIQSKIINLSELNRNILVEKKLATEQQVLSEKQAYSYINTFVNEFYFLLDDELAHVSQWITKYLKSSNDRVETFRGMEQLYEKIHGQKTNPQFDLVFLFVRNEDLPKVNRKLLPQNCFLVEILSQDFKGLQVSEKEHLIKLTKLPFLKLAQKILIEAMLTHIILYQRTANKTPSDYFNQQVTHLLSLFPEGQFIKQPYDSPLSFDMISTLVDDPKFNRLYIICNEKEMANVVDQLARVDQETGVPEEICKIICIPQDNQILRHEEKIESYPRVAWMTNSSKIQDYKSLIKYALRQQEDENLYTRQQSEEKQKIFYHTRHRNLNTLIEKQFPQRFEFQAFNSLGQVEKKLLKTKTEKAKEVLSPSKKPTQQKSKPTPTMINYLILHPILSEEYIDAKLFKKIFMLGKSDKTQRKVVKVGSNQELMELLKR